MLQVFVRAGEGVVAALKLSAADEDAAVGVGRRAEFQAQNKIFREVPGGGKLLNSAPFGRSGDDQSSILGDKSPVGAARLAVEADGGRDDGPGRGVWIAGLPFSGGFFVRVRRGPESLASEAFSIGRVVLARSSGSAVFSARATYVCHQKQRQLHSHLEIFSSRWF